MDALTDILQTLRLQSQLYYRTQLTAPWGIDVPDQGRVARFHIVIRGQCWIHVDGEAEGMTLSPGDLLVIPHGRGHRMADSAETLRKPLPEVLEEAQYIGSGPLIYGGGGAGCTLVCGEFRFDESGQHPLLDNLPSALFITGDESYNTQWLDSAISFIAHEAHKLAPGAHAIIDRLAEIIFIQSIRASLARSEDTIPFLSAFADKRINAALEAIHAAPDKAWSVESLGLEANMSRSAFAKRFSELTGMGPMHYLSFVRLQKAQMLLTNSQDSLLHIATAVGYQSEAAFSLAFLRQFGSRPGEYRRQLRQTPATVTA